MYINFTKMHGLGNDFVVIDNINQKFIPNKNIIKNWSNRNMGIGFDQLLIVEKPKDINNDFNYKIFNADGKEVEQCGNGARCFAIFVKEKSLSKKKVLKVETKKRIIELNIIDENLVRVDMGIPLFENKNIPFISYDLKGYNDLYYEIKVNNKKLKFLAVNIGNPHITIFLDNIDLIDIESISNYIQESKYFPESVNIGFAQKIDESCIRLRVYERGVGETLACGTGACAAAINGIRLKLLKREVKVSLLGGDLIIKWEKNKNILMTGPAISIFDGKIKL